MDLRQLRYFAQIVESGSLSKASRQLYVAQPALSQVAHVRHLRLEAPVVVMMNGKRHEGVILKPQG